MSPIHNGVLQDEPSPARKVPEIPVFDGKGKEKPLQGQETPTSVTQHPISSISDKFHRLFH